MQFRQRKRRQSSKSKPARAALLLQRPKRAHRIWQLPARCRIFSSHQRLNPRRNPHSARPGRGPPPAISCLGAFRTPVAGACGKIVVPGVRKPAQVRTFVRSTRTLPNQFELTAPDVENKIAIPIFQFVIVDRGDQKRRAAAKQVGQGQIEEELVGQTDMRTLFRKFFDDFVEQFLIADFKRLKSFLNRS